MSDTKKTLMDREYTRRQFMKLSGKGLAGVALSSTLLSLMGCTRSQAEAGLVDTIATPDFLLVANPASAARSTAPWPMMGTPTPTWPASVFART